MSSNNDDDLNPSIPSWAIDDHGDVIPSFGVSNGEPSLDEQLKMFEEEDEDILFDEDVDKESYRGFNTYHRSVHSQSKNLGINTSLKSSQSLDRQLNSSIDELVKQYKTNLDKPAEQGMKGKINKVLPFLSLAPSLEEKEDRKKKYQKRKSKIYSSAAIRGIKEIGNSKLNIMSTEDRYIAPAVAVESQKGGSGKTTVIISLCQYFALALYMKQKKENADSIKPALLADMNPDRGTLTSRVPNMVNEFGNKMDVLTLAEEVIYAKENEIDFNAIEHTFPTKWDYMRAIPNPKLAKDRDSIKRHHIESIYDAMCDDISIFMMDNGTDIDSFQNHSSIGLANAIVLVTEATANESAILEEIQDHKKRQDESPLYKGAMDRLIVVIVIKQDSEKLRNEAYQKKSRLLSQGIPSIVIPYEPNMALGKKIIIGKTTQEYRAAIAALSHYILNFLNKPSDSTIVEED